MMLNQSLDALLQRNSLTDYPEDKSTGSAFSTSLSPEVQCVRQTGYRYHRVPTFTNQCEVLHGNKTFPLAWYLSFQVNHKQELSRAEMTEIISGIQHLMKYEEYWLLNSIVSRTLSAESSPSSIVTLLRSTFAARAFLKDWDALLNNSVEWLKRKGKDPKSILIGLV